MPIGHISGKLCMRRIRKRAMYETETGGVQGKLIMLEHPVSLTEVQMPRLSLSELSLVLQSVHQPTSPESLLQFKKPQILSLLITLNLQWDGVGVGIMEQKVKLLLSTIPWSPPLCDREKTREEKK
ncbi:uncharacterized [Tachysurus ichikawai]